MNIKLSKEELDILCAALTYYQQELDDPFEEPSKELQDSEKLYQRLDKERKG